MDNDTKKILLMIARALQVNVLAQLKTNILHSRLHELVEIDALSARKIWLDIEEREKKNA